MRKYFSLLLTLLFLFSVVSINAADKKDESKIKINKYSFKHALVTKIDTKDAYFEEGFEGEFPPAGWTLTPGDGDDWAQSDGTIHGPGSVAEGTYAIYFDDYNYSSGTTASITTPAIDLSGATLPILEFYYWDSGGSDYVEVMISTNGIDYSSLYNTATSVSTWTKQTVDLSAYVGEATVYVQFVGTSVWGTTNPYVDQVVVTEPAADPIQTVNYTSVNFGLKEVNSTSSTGDVFIISNTGGGEMVFTSAAGFDGTPFSTNFDDTVTLTAGQTDTFAVDFMPTAEGDFSAEFIIESNGGIDTITATGSAYDPSLFYVEGFENSVPPTDWAAEILSGTYNWEQYTWASAIEGENVAKYNSYSASTGSQAELISQKLDLTQNNNDFVAFYYAHPTTYSGYTDNLRVYFSDDDGTNWVLVDSLVFQDYSWHLQKYFVADYISDTNSTDFRVKFLAESDYGTSQYIDQVILPPQYVSLDVVDWCNLQWPPTGSITQGDSFTAYGQVYKSGVTEADGPGDGIEVWFAGYDENTDPSTWAEEHWDVAEFNTQSGNNDEFMFTVVADDVPAGTYYYTFRYRYNGGPYSYGGYSADGGNFWDGVNYVSGEVVVNAFVVTTFPYEQGFEGESFPPTGWSNEDELWSRGSEAHSGSYAAKASYSHSGEAILKTPAITLGDTLTRISFWWKDDDISNGPTVATHDTTFFEISTDDVSWTTLGFISQESHDSEYQFAQFDLTDYATQTIYLRWRDVTDATGSAWGIGLDDILIEEYRNGPGMPSDPNPEDGAVNIDIHPEITWTNPEPTFYNVVYGSENYEDVLTMVDSAIQLDGSVDTTVYSSITPYEFPYSTTIYWRVVEYDETLGASEGPVWLFTTMDNPHPEPFNLVANGNIGYADLAWNFIPPVEPGSFREGFEGGAISDDWANVDQDADGNSWGTWDAFVHTGIFAATSFSYSNTTGALTPDNWLISPAVALGDNPELTFYAGASDVNWYAEHFEVKISTVDQDPATFATQLLDVTLGADAAAQFVMYSVDLSAYAGQTVYLAWVHNNISDMFNLTIDDIKVTGIQDTKDLNFTFETQKERGQFKMVQTTNTSAPLKYVEGSNSSTYKEKVEKFVSTHKGHVELPKALTHFNVYRNDEILATADSVGYRDLAIPTYNETYSYYVTAYYEDGVESSQSNVAEAYVLDPASVILYNDFETGELPEYYTIVNANDDQYTWEAYNGYAQSGEYSMAVRWNSSMAMDDWAYIGPINMYAGESYDLAFGFRAASSTWTENMAVYVTDGVDSSKAIVHTLFDSTGIANTTYADFSGSFDMAADGEYYIAFHGYSDADMFRLAVDDILLMGNGSLVQPVDSSIVFFDDFENGADNWQLLGAWGIVTEESYSPIHSFTESPDGNYPDGAIYFATMNPTLDFSEVMDAELSFMTKYEIEEGFDYMYLDIHYDGISGWRELAAYDGIVSDWTEMTVPLGGYVGKTGVKFRFRFESDAGFNMNGMYIDDFTVRVSNEDLSAPLVSHAGPEGLQGVMSAFVIEADITDISGVQSAYVGYVVDPETPVVETVVVEADSVSGDTYYFSIPEQEAGARVYYAFAVMDVLGNADTVAAPSGEPFSYISGNYLMYDDDVVTFVQNFVPGTSAAMRMSLPTNTAADLVTALLRNYTDANRPNGDLDVHVWADNAGQPGADLITPIRMTPFATLSDPYRLTVCDLRDYSAELSSLEGDFWIGFSVPTDGAEVWLTVGREDTELGGDTRSYVSDGSSWTMNNREFQFRAITGPWNEVGVGDGMELPKKFELMQNYPNPFNPATTIKFALPQATDVSMKVFNAIGQEVATLVNKDMEAGYHEINFDASKLSSGLYIYRIQAGNFVSVKKMMLLK